MGANVNMVVKSGTRDLHGSLYEYFRNDVLDANDFFANKQGRGKVPFRQNQYGVSFGGPVLIPKLYNGRDKTFWFVNWEGYRRRRGTTGISTSPIEAQRNGDFSQLTGPPDIRSAPRPWHARTERSFAPSSSGIVSRRRGSTLLSNFCWTRTCRCRTVQG